MSEVWRIVLWTTLAGATMPLGALIARADRVFPRWLELELRHGIIAFGGGILLAAVALVLVPGGMERCSGWQIVAAMASGGLAFLGLDLLIQRRGGSAAQLLAMLADFLSEALALGALGAVAGGEGALLAILIASQNLPEGFNAYREIRDTTGERPARIVAMFAALVPLGPAAGLTGLFVLSGHASAVGFLMLFASGGILYLVFQDIGPQARLERHWGPPFGAVLGFLAGVLGQLALHG